MTKILRRIVFFLFVAVFFIGAPRIVFYALGYSYKPGSDNGLVKTGLIYLSTTPPGATVYVGGRRYHDTTPAIIRDLLPQTYPIKLMLKDYEIWAQDVPVEAAKASVLGKVLLHPKKPDWRVCLWDRYDDLVPVPDTKYLLLKKGNSPGGAQIFDWKEKKAKPASSENLKAQSFFKTKKIADDEIFAVNGKGQFFLIESGEILVNEGVLGFRYDKKNHKAVIWTQDSIGLAEMIKSKKEPGLVQKRVKLEWVFKQGQKISQVFWAHDGAYVLFQDRSKVFMLELETFGAPSVYELLETKNESHIFYSDESGELFYLDKKIGNLMSVEVIPKWKVLEIPFAILQEKEKEGKVARL